MASLIEGFFEVVDPREFGDEATGTTSSPQRDRSYLTLYDSYIGLGPEKKTWLPCKLRIYAPGQDLSDNVLHVHGRFVIVPTSGGEDPCFKIEVHRFLPMVDFIQDEKKLRFSVTFYGRIYQQIDSPPGTEDGFFSVEVSDYVRDRSQSYIIRFVVSWFAPARL